jgi:hypothetical protein
VRKTWSAWRELAGYIGDFQARLLLTIFYFVLVPPFGLLARYGVDPLQLRRAPTPSAWSARSPVKPTLESGRSQF